MLDTVIGHCQTLRFNPLWTVVYCHGTSPSPMQKYNLNLSLTTYASDDALQPIFVKCCKAWHS